MIAREAIAQSERDEDLDPQFYTCPSECDHGDWCKQKQSEETFLRNCREKVKEIEGADRYSFDALLNFYYDALDMDGSVDGKGYSPRWTETERMAVKVIRSENYRAKRISDWQWRQEMKAKANG